jgi:hypothetical protein
MIYAYCSAAAVTNDACCDVLAQSLYLAYADRLVYCMYMYIIQSGC